MRQRLPAWLWGREAKGGWQVLDSNPASDSDLWLAYALLEAGARARDRAAAGTGADAAARPAGLRRRRSDPDQPQLSAVAAAATVCIG
ncbi:hypothetical protein G6F63_016033 [Rhizopus arrhizus]|nr:hypothetical protein G6F63_016033 [Rhizopus arrhizus]